MFKKQKKDKYHKIPSQKVETIIGPDIKVKGNFHGQGNTVIEGELEGSLKTDADVFVGDNAKILANIEAKKARVGGKVSGNIKIKEHLEIVSSGNIEGNMECGSLSIEAGAIINGEIKMAAPENKTKGPLKNHQTSTGPSDSSAKAQNNESSEK